MSRDRSRLFVTAALLLAGASSACSPSDPIKMTGAGGSGSPGTAGTTGAAGSSSPGTAGDGAAGTGSGAAGTTGAGGSGSQGTAGTTGAAGSGSQGTAGTTGAAGSGTQGTAGTTGAAGAQGAAGTTGAAGTGATSADCSPPSGKTIHVTGTNVFNMSFNGQPMFLDHSKSPIRGKLWLFLGGIGGGPGSGGFDSFVKMYGFHVFMPKTDTNLVGGSVPQKYKDMLKTDPNSKEANRQVGDARMELWDGKDRVDWYTPPTSILQETIDAIKFAMDKDPGGDWGYFLNDDGTLRTTDVVAAGYSWGAQTWSMISTYVRFGRVLPQSGPVNEGFPNGTWMTDPSATPVKCKYALVSDGQADDIFPNVIKAGWIGPTVPVMLSSKGPYTEAQHLFEMIGGDGGTSPGGHTVFCNNNPANQWWPACKHVVGVEE